ncbi:WXG100 family type VII secretion target [Nocardia panacis]|uniref:WXG100 family type VII secretion target n=1 Tax=Nocardia panacis TaxID=2340916 RepID=A0A3A4KRX5_9NOCA|nr:WXG100 family type VII secretion target [Nocardia panacis]RJO78716.1 WXG100 family type VII secretion target [Nocardia panacis]
MTDSPFSVDLDHLDRIVAKLAGLAEYIAENIDSIDTRVATLKSGTWAGVAADAYHEAHSQLMVGARELGEGIRDISAGARTAHTSYSEAGNANSRLFRRDGNT